MDTFDPRSNTLGSVVRAAIKLLVAIGLVHWLPNAWSSAAETDRAELAGNVVDDVRTIAVCWVHQANNQQSISALQKAASRLAMASEDDDGPLADALRLYQARAQVILANKERAMAFIAQGIGEDVDVPELLELKAYLTPTAELQARIDIWEELGALFPLSSHGAVRDRRHGNPAIKTNPPLPKLPQTSKPLLMERIGDLYMEMGFSRRAIDSYIVALYGGWSQRNGQRDLWHRVADIERSLGQRSLAIRAYLKAAYYDESLSDVTIARDLAVCLSEQDVERRNEPAANLDAEKALEIVNLYAELNMHPLALSLLKELSATTGKSYGEAEKRIAAEWEGILKRHVSLRGPDCYVYGHAVSEVEDWSNAKILRPSDTFWKPSKPAEDTEVIEESDAPQQ